MYNTHYYLLCIVLSYYLPYIIYYVRVYICTGWYTRYVRVYICTLVHSYVEPYKRTCTEEVSGMDGSDGWMEYAYACTSARGGS